MDKGIVLTRIRAIFIESLHLDLREDEVEPGTPLSMIAPLDSMAALEFVTAIETEFQIAIEPEKLDLNFIQDLPRLAEFVEARLRR